MELILIPIVFVISFISVSNAYSAYPLCATIDNQFDISVYCTSVSKSSSHSCVHDMYDSSSSVLKRSKVRKLILKDDYDGNYDQCKIIANDMLPIDRLFEQVRELSHSSPSTTLYPHLKFKYLEKFDASNGNLESLSKSNFENLKNLKQIDFSNNFISNIEEGTFYSNAKLSFINLSYNALFTVNRETFSKQSELKILDLSFNLIKEIDKRAFENNQKLEELRLEMNPLHRFDCHMFSIVQSLKFLNVTLYTIMELDVSCAFEPSADSDEFVIHFRGVENDLRISNEYLANLRVINMAGKCAENMMNVLNLLGPELEALDLSHIELGKLRANTIKNFKSLKSLKLSNTDLIFDAENPFRYQIHLEELDLSLNNLTQMNFTLLTTTLQHLVALNISRCELVFPGIDSVDFVLLKLLSPSIESLDLSFNWLTQRKSLIFQNFTNLRSLNLRQTRFQQFTFSTFYQLSKLETLDLSYNSLLEIDFSLFFRKLTNVVSLNLAGNNLTSINTVTQSIFPQLLELDIRDNEFTCVYLATFLKDWPQLTLTSHPSNGPQIAGINCKIQQNDSVSPEVILRE